MKKRRGFSSKVSNFDQSLIQYSYHSYDVDEIEDLRFTFNAGCIYLKGAKAGQITLKETQQHNEINSSGENGSNHNSSNPRILAFLDTGSVDSISSNLQRVEDSVQPYFRVKTSINKKAVLDLFSFRLCDHIPEDKVVNKLIEDLKKMQQQKQEQKKKIPKTAPIFCKNCSQRIFYFYLPQVKSIKFRDLLKHFDIEQEQELQKIQLTKILNEPFTKPGQIATYDDKSFNLQQGGKVSFIADIKDLSLDDKQKVVFSYKQIYCQHQKINFNICQYCLEEISPERQNLRKFLFQMQEKDDFKRQMITSGSTLTEQENAFADELLEKQKGILILDLDNTVLHSIEINQLKKDRLTDIEEYYTLMMSQQIYIGKYVCAGFIVKMRPFFKEFIQTVVKHYEIYIYTKGTRNYAEEICNAVRNQYASNNHFSSNENNNLKYYSFLSDKNAFTSNRIITRDQDPDLLKKSLDNILPTRQQNLMIMDDLGSVWNYSAAVLYTVPYHYFFKKKHIENQKNQCSIPQNKIQALDQGKQGQKLQPIEDLHVENIQPVRQLPCDHFQREIIQIQSKLIEPVNQLPCDHFEKQIENIDKKQTKRQKYENGVKQETLPNQVTPIMPDVIEIKNPVAPEDKNYDYDILPRKDFYLVYASSNLLEIHRKFFAERKSQTKIDKKTISLAQVHRKLKKEMLNGITIKFCMKNDTKIDIYGRAVKLGCKILQGESQELPNYCNYFFKVVIRLNSIKDNVNRMYFKKEQQIEKKQAHKNKDEIQRQTLKQLKYYSQTLKIPIVSQSWIDFCYSFTYKFPVQPFILQDENVFKDVKEERFQWIIEDHAMKILEKIRESNTNGNNEENK